jgi:hypothetical protein
MASDSCGSSARRRSKTSGGVTRYRPSRGKWDDNPPGRDDGFRRRRRNSVGRAVPTATRSSPLRSAADARRRQLMDAMGGAPLYAMSDALPRRRDEGVIRLIYPP